MTRPTKKRTSLTTLIARLGWGAALAGVFVGACSLGEGVTATCDPSLPNGDPGACQQIAACDDGNGGVDPDLTIDGTPCCVYVASRQLQQCTQNTTASLFDCPAGGGGSDCCNSGAVQDTYTLCLSGNLGSSASSGGGGMAGMGGSGGTGGAGGTGGTGGTGGAAGGAGGAGGN